MVSDLKRDTKIDKRGREKGGSNGKKQSHKYIILSPEVYRKYQTGDAYGEMTRQSFKMSQSR